MSHARLQPRPPGIRRIDVPSWARLIARRAPAEVTLTEARIPGAAQLDSSSLRNAVRNAYRESFDAVGDRHVVRAWNVVPGICDPLADGDRYMAFNAGRYDAIRERFGDALAARVPAASGVGGEGDELTIRLLAVAAPGEPIENPRQTPAFRYSPKYGPLPPCFARATRATIAARSWLLVSGTAAILGEETRAIGDAHAQLNLTVDNLRGLLAASGGPDRLDRFASIRVYLPAATFEDESLRAATRDAFAGCDDVEFVAAELCRRNLLIEIEGVATCDATGHSGRNEP